jgi:short-subunit dehydrogenase
VGQPAAASTASDYKARYGDWALVVGGSEGLGAALAAELARRGMNLVLVARREGVLRATAGRLSAEFGVQTHPVVADMAAPQGLEHILAGLGGIEVGFVIFNCAAEHRGEFLQQPVENHLDNIVVNCIAPTRVLHHFGREMVSAGRGGLVICSSLASVQGIYSWVSYGAAKAYDAILGEGLWYELREHGVGAATLMIGSTYTPNFQRNQREKKTLFAETRTPDNLPPGVQPPQDPADAAANLFAQIDREWIPLVYANPADEAQAKAMQSTSRIDKIVRISDAMKTGFRSMASG